MKADKQNQKLSSHTVKVHQLSCGSWQDVNELNSQQSVLIDRLSLTTHTLHYCQCDALEKKLKSEVLSIHWELTTVWSLTESILLVINLQRFSLCNAQKPDTVSWPWWAIECADKSNVAQWETRVPHLMLPHYPGPAGDLQLRVQSIHRRLSIRNVCAKLCRKDRSRSNVLVKCRQAEDSRQIHWQNIYSLPSLFLSHLHSLRTDWKHAQRRTIRKYVNYSLPVFQPKWTSFSNKRWFLETLKDSKQ